MDGCFSFIFSFIIINEDEKAHTFSMKIMNGGQEMEEREITKRLLTEFEEKLRQDEKSELTVEKYLRDVRQFMVFLSGERIDKSLVLAYKAHLEKNYAVASANSMIASINSFFRLAGWNDLFVKQFKVQKQTFCKEEKELTKGEYVRLCKTAEKAHNERLCLILQTICGTGIRVSELQFITVEAARCGTAVVSCKNKTRTVFMVRQLQKKLLSYCKRQGITTGQVFVTKTGKPMSRTNIWREMKSLCQEAGVNPKKVFPHNLRHLFARVFYGIEKDIAKLADILGHSSINTTRIYIMTTGVEHRKRMETMRLIL